MKVKDIKIETQLKLGFSLTLMFVVLMGVISHFQNSQIHLQTELLYSHPFQVRRAIGVLNTNIVSMRLGTRDLMLATTSEEKQAAIQLIEVSAADALRQFDILRTQYLGPSSHVEEAYNAFVKWKIAREENTRLALAGDIDKVKESIQSTGTVGVYRDIMLAEIKVIDDFARNKADVLYNTSLELYSSLTMQLILFCLAILLLLILINYILLRAVRNPIEELIGATNRFHKGDLDARSSYDSKNEFGELSASFNKMVETIQIKVKLDEKFSALAELMLSEYDVKRFFQSTLNSLSMHTGSQMAAIYLLSDDKKTFEYFESIGVDDNARQSFAADRFDGEFGAVLSTRSITHLKCIPHDTRFVFNTVSGKFIPREIITLPIIADNQVIAIISLSSVSEYSQQSIQLIDRIHVTLCARVEGILAYHKMREFSQELEHQNSELELQKIELASQSAELTEQNTELEMQKNQLDEANKLKTNFLSNMSHELRTPLNSVIALTGVLGRRLAKQIPEEELSFLEIIERNGKHLLNLINDILDISRIEAGREEIEISTFKPCDIVNEVVSMINPQAQQKNIDLLKAKGDCDISISSDAGKFRHILQNLISNAVKFTEKGKVEISAVHEDKNIQISVIDTGIGISENHLSIIFDEFRQADSTTSRRFGGSGLGLAIAKKYAILLGGTISVKSTLGKGSEFTFILPISYSPHNRVNIAETLTPHLNNPIKKPSQKNDSEPSQKTILLVEDSEPAIIQMKDFLGESGCKILVARDGGEALDIIAKTIPDAMILDLMMPVIDGFEVLKTVREAEPTAHIPILILTAKHITKEELQFLKRNNVHQLIQKGDINRTELLNAVTSMLYLESPEPGPIQKELQNIEGRPMVLIVEDNPDNMTTAKAILADDYIVLEATDGSTGIEMAKKHLPHLILMDIALPVFSGIEAFKSIRNFTGTQHIPIIALTASALTEDREAILAHGFDAYIVKPIDEKEFFKTIIEVLYGK